MAEPDRSITPAWTVMSVQTINGRKHISVQNEEYGITIEWIEGIGTPHILWPQGRTCYATGMEVQTERTLCTADNGGNILYSFNTDDLGIRNECPNWHSADTTTPANDVRCTKVLIDGQLYIRLGDKTYTLTGIQSICIFRKKATQGGTHYTRKNDPQSRFFSFFLAYMIFF